MRRLGAAWQRLWFADSDPYPMAAFRVILGIYLLVYLGAMMPHVTTLFSNHGVYVPYGFGDYAPRPTVAIGVFAATYALVVAFTLGYRTRVVTPLLLTGFLYHYFLDLAVKHSSYDRLVIVYLAVLSCVAVGRVWSIDAWSRRDTDRSVPAWAGHVLRFQTVALYFGAGLWKAVHPAWRSGALLEAEMQGMWATPLGFWLAGQDFGMLFWAVVSWTIICFELFVGILLFRRRTRVVAVAGLTFFHLANTVVLFIPEFLVCLAPLVLFIEPARLRAMVASDDRDVRGVVVGSPRQHA